MSMAEAGAVRMRPRSALAELRLAQAA